MVRANNYETVSTSVEVMQKKNVAHFFPDTVYRPTRSRLTTTRVLFLKCAGFVIRVSLGDAADSCL